MSLSNDRYIFRADVLSEKFQYILFLGEEIRI